MIVSGEIKDEVVVGLFVVVIVVGLPVVGLFVVVGGLFVVGLLVVVVGLLIGFVVGLFVGTAIVGVSGRGTNGLNATDGLG